MTSALSLDLLLPRGTERRCFGRTLYYHGLRAPPAGLAVRLRAPNRSSSRLLCAASVSRVGEGGGGRWGPGGWGAGSSGRSGVPWGSPPAAAGIWSPSVPTEQPDRISEPAKSRAAAARRPASTDGDCDL